MDPGKLHLKPTRDGTGIIVALTLVRFCSIFSFNALRNLPSEDAYESGTYSWPIRVLACLEHVTSVVVCLKCVVRVLDYLEHVVCTLSLAGCRALSIST